MIRRLLTHSRALTLNLSLGLTLGVMGALAAASPADAVPGMAAQHLLNPYGRWLNPAGDVEVSVAPCGTLLCGTVTWVLSLIHI